ncbi:hypothetical protein NOX90_03785 [Wolbachia endosymbiont of Anurida maritima]|uniref:WD_0033/WD_0034 family tandem repeat-containing protein n=1 Tax=Wolbachia endosymbiont of Anurida maritima TaxID=2850562 RepID=UPI0035D0EF26
MKTSKLTLVCDIYELTNKDGKNIQKLVREIEEGKGIAGRFRNGIFKRSSYNASTILLTKITYKYQSREKTLSLLHYAISHKNNQAVKDLLEEAKKQKLLKEVLNEEMTTKHSDGREENHTILTDAISRRDNDIMRAVLKTSEENGILKDILKKRITIKHSNGKEMTYTPFTYAEACKNSEAVRELGNLLNERATQQSTVVTAKTTTAKDENSKEVHEICKYSVTNKDTTHAIDKATETDTQLCKDINEKSEIEQPMFESSEEAQNDSTTVEPTSVDRADSPSSAEPCFDATDEKEGPLMQQRQAILAGVVGAVLLASGVALYIMKMPVVAAVVGIVGLACISFALYHALKPNTKLEKVDDVEQLDVKSLPSL